MARIREEMVVLKVSTLVKGDGNDVADVLDSELCASLEAVVAELVGDKHIVEIIKD